MATVHHITRRDVINVKAPERPTTLTGAIERHRAIFAEIGTLLPVADETDDRHDPVVVPYYGALMNAELEALNAVIAWPARTLAEVREKAAYMLAPPASLWRELDEHDCRRLLESVA